ncbi:hypothetical protein SFBM_0142 [Candidatus Arthromitus sp. SFB-mouse-Japan]|nr:hypothetical protein SFBNYU_013690 [Candidatus Arthromitus sp. SFB-mouse-NYU]EIA22536.1 hypothetical protein SFB2_248G4 [Candidatus Arthromitus sp. SFB-2]EIA23771.1 hypothetical protein SFB3_248G3 [Candidatus Arthromitus sp. SFB-3]EIA25160.1 hypothetical protein SFB1_003G16 [Candidatus Arthromitus sp. SFB-1]EIA27202.1 hypothetical protein SFB4_195G3 [Candidatus Arthromitus sp. SFB-4]EIA28171.1 hypothetical protein SFB6_063G4 [Candidatus Arthromitus sp. SFB-co]EIA28386.1 hypothetical protei
MQIKKLSNCFKATSTITKVNKRNTTLIISLSEVFYK